MTNAISFCTVFDNFPKFAWFIFCQICQSFTFYLFIFAFSCSFNFVVFCFWSKEFVPVSLCSLSKKSIMSWLNVFLASQHSVLNHLLFIVRCVWFVYRLWERRSPNTVKAWSCMNSLNFSTDSSIELSLMLYVISVQMCWWEVISLITVSLKELFHLIDSVVFMLLSRGWVSLVCLSIHSFNGRTTRFVRVL